MLFAHLAVWTLGTTAVSAATIAQLLNNLPAGKTYTLNKIAAVASNYPEWSNAGAQVSLIVPRDADNTETGTRPGLFSYVGGLLSTESGNWGIHRDANKYAIETSM